MRRPGKRRSLLLLSGLLLLACPERKSESPPAPLPPCTQVGQRCEFSPGKLGSCVQRDDCHEQNCFVCQSQH
jgi:hypothetical protein